MVQIYKNEAVSITTDCGILVLEDANVFEEGDDLIVRGTAIRTINIGTEMSVVQFVSKLDGGIITILEKQLTDIQSQIIQNVKTDTGGDKLELLEIIKKKHPFYRSIIFKSLPLPLLVLVYAFRAVMWFVSLTMIRFNPVPPTNPYIGAGIYDSGQRIPVEFKMPAEQLALIKVHKHVNDIVKNITL